VKGEETKEEEELTVLKTLRYEHDFSDRNYDRHRKDALASERLSGSPHVVDIYAFCQNTAVFEYGEEGDIEGKLFPYNEEDGKYYVADLSSWEKLDLAYQVACGVADIHDVEEDGIASIAHTDITPSQFIYIDGKWKINDFNRCRFMREYKVNRTVCGFEVNSNPGKFRSPEEYAYEVETEKIDVYSMGNVLYSIISGMMPFEGLKSEKAMKAVMEGKRPKIPRDVEESDDIAIQAILSATKACWIHDPKDRPPATEIRDLLKSVMDRIKKENTTINSS
jgi:serine/threonine protein kinase